MRLSLVRHLIAVFQEDRILGEFCGQSDRTNYVVRLASSLAKRIGVVLVPPGFEVR
ncbi:MAG: hypothetical protein P8O23_01920 [Opitutales bacterium]|nr:hypothetical protein [Opitutales bacterium]